MGKKEIRRFDLDTLRTLNLGDPTFVSDNVGMIKLGNKSPVNNVLPMREPIMLDEARIGLIRKGEGQYTVNLIPRVLKGGTIAFLGKGTIVQFDKLSDDFEMEGMALSDFLLGASFGSRQGIPLIGQYPDLFLQASESEAKVVDSLLTTAWELMHQETEFSHEAVGSIFAALLHYVSHLNDKHQHQQRQMVSHGHEVFRQFVRMINKHCRQERMLSFYANELCITERYLSALIKQESGLTAKEWIDKAVITEAKVMLKHTDKQIAEISDELNFANTSFFCKYFRRNTGLSPQEYRTLQN